jgi:hypothetical protein
LTYLQVGHLPLILSVGLSSDQIERGLGARHRPSARRSRRLRVQPRNVIAITEVTIRGGGARAEC